MKKRTILFVLLCILLTVSGLFLILYPTMHAWKSSNTSNQAVQRFRENTSKTASTEPIHKPQSTDKQAAETEPVNVKYPELLQAMQSYNQHIWIDGQSDLCDAWSYEKPAFDLEDYGIEDEVFGIISIPKMDLELPLFLGATEEHLANGAAQLSQTSIPIGGNNTNSVIAGHRGWNGALLFRHIELLEIGDEVTITNLWNTLTYRVVDIQIIEPYEVSKVLIQTGRDLLTLLTCHPYGSGGRYRYVVYCERVP